MVIFFSFNPSLTTPRTIVVYCVTFYGDIWREIKKKININFEILHEINAFENMIEP